tara:strand:- start:113 stop:502 length:390 start_codon:yes stop_codon:yes gene_type:complete
MKYHLLIFSLVFVFNCSNTKEQNLKGVWQYVSGEYKSDDSTLVFTNEDVNSMKVYSDKYYSMNTHIKSSGDYFAHSGLYSLNGDEYTEIFKINKNPEMVGKSETFKYQISRNQLEISSEWLKEVWIKIE